MDFLEVSKGLTDEEIGEFEQAMDVNLPQDFKQHYLKYNGGYPGKDTYHWQNGDSTTLNTFFSIKYPGFGLIENVYENLVTDEKILPEKIIPFATDDGGNFFCISARKKDYGSVYYCNNDHYNVDNKEECLSLLNKNFNEFLLGLSDS